MPELSDGLLELDGDWPEADVWGGVELPSFLALCHCFRNCLNSERGIRILRGKDKIE